MLPAVIVQALRNEASGQSAPRFGAFRSRERGIFGWHLRQHFAALLALAAIAGAPPAVADVLSLFRKPEGQVSIAPPSMSAEELGSAPAVEKVVASSQAPEEAVLGRALLRRYIETTLQQNPQILQAESDSRAAEFRVLEAKGNRYPRLSAQSNIASERFNRESNADTSYRQRSGELRAVMPLIDPTLSAQIDQRQSASVSADWKLADVREQLILRTIETYVELTRASRLIDIAQENLTTHRDYVGQVKDIARIDLGRAADLSAAAARTALAEAVLASRVARFDIVRSQWRQLTGLEAPLQFPDLPSLDLPGDMHSVLNAALEDHPVIHLANAELSVARDGVALAKGPYRPRLNLEANARFGHDWGGYQGFQNSHHLGIWLEIPLFSGFADRYAIRAAEEVVQSALHAVGRMRNELRARVEQNWYELQSSAASLKAFEEYERNARQMAEATRNQFKIGRRSLLDVLNAENELFTARSNIETSYLDLVLASWRLRSLRYGLAAEIGL